MENTDKEQINWQLAQMSAEVKELWLAAQQGDVDAQFKLGKAYYDVEGVAGWNEEQTLYWLRKAAEQGHIQAQYLYVGLKSDDQEAAYWLCELAQQHQVGVELDESTIPVQEAVAGLCELLGFDPLYVANEGRFVAFVPAAEQDQALQILRSIASCRDACVIGTVSAIKSGIATAKTVIGGQRVLDMLSGAQLPRIC